MQSVYRDWAIRPTRLRELYCQWDTTAEELFRRRWFSAMLSCLNRSIVVSFQLLRAGHKVELRIEKIQIDESSLGIHVSLGVWQGCSRWTITFKSVWFNSYRGDLPDVYSDSLVIGVRGRRDATFHLLRRVNVSVNQFGVRIGDIVGIRSWWEFIVLTRPDPSWTVPFLLSRISPRASEVISKFNARRSKTGDG